MAVVTDIPLKFPWLGYRNCADVGLLADKVTRHYPPLQGPPVYALPVLNQDRTDHNTKPMEHLCIATVA